MLGVLAQNRRTNYVKSKLPERLARQKVTSNEFFRKVKIKLEKARAKGYTAECKDIKAYTNCFTVPKTWREATTKKG